MAQNHLLIFVKNLIPGQVKTRLAEDIGIDGALDIYMALVQHTHNEVMKVDAIKNIYYSDYVEVGDVWDHEDIQYHLQEGNDLGQKMTNAFFDSFENEAEKVVIIGSDCWDLKSKHLKGAFAALDEYDIVIGPARDGGYYLLGMNEPHPELFTDKEYSHGAVLTELLDEIEQKNLKFKMLDELSDIDTLEDMKDTALMKILEAEEDDGSGD